VSGPAILSLGSINADFLVRTERALHGGETLAATDFRRLGGGKAANVALLAHRLLHPVVLLGRVGDDELREQALAPLRAAGIPLDGVSTAAGTPTAVDVVDSTGAETPSPVRSPSRCSRAWTRATQCSSRPPRRTTPSPHRARRNPIRRVRRSTPSSHASRAMSDRSDRDPVFLSAFRLAFGRYVADDERRRESLFGLGNGALCVRASPSDATVRTDSIIPAPIAPAFTAGVRSWWTAGCSAMTAWSTSRTG
jgi:hypothetical protein